MVKKMPMFGSRMHPSCVKANILLEDCICNGELVLCAQHEPEAPIAITVIITVPTKKSFLGH